VSSGIAVASGGSGYVVSKAAVEKVVGVFVVNAVMMATGAEPGRVCESFS
jgi:hypothetical protein